MFIYFLPVIGVKEIVGRSVYVPDTPSLRFVLFEPLDVDNG
ncbi:MAG: hypothetical protein ACXWCY_08045 [Burkholderiales bacterium]